MWYEEPGWFAIAISLISLLVSLLVLRRSQRATRRSVQQQLMQRATEIGEAFSEHRVPGPHDSRGTMAFPAKSVMLLQQVNLLRDVFEHREVLGKHGVAAYKNWADIMVRPWVESDAELRKSWDKLRQPSGRHAVKIQGWPIHVSQEFVAWLDELMPLQDAETS